MTAAAPDAASSPQPETAAQAMTQAASGLSALPLRRDSAAEPSTAGAWIVIALLVVAAMGAIWLRRAKSARAGASMPSLRRLETLALTSQSTLHVVKWGNEEILLGCGPAGVTVLSRRAQESTSEGGQA